MKKAALECVSYEGSFGRCKDAAWALSAKNRAFIELIKNASMVKGIQVVLSIDTICD
jgi:hypothetical protein